MKRWFYILLLSAAISSCGRKLASTNVPEPVMSSFQKQFPLAKNAEWKSNGKNYKVNFHNPDKYMYAKYKEDGSLSKAMRQCTVACLESN